MVISLLGVTRRQRAREMPLRTTLDQQQPPCAFQSQLFALHFVILELIPPFYFFFVGNVYQYNKLVKLLQGMRTNCLKP